MLITGYDKVRRIYSILDTTTTEFDQNVKEGEKYTPFVISYEALSNMYESYKTTFNDSYFVSVPEDNKVPPHPGVDVLIDCLDLFINDIEEQPYIEVDLINEFINSIETGSTPASFGLDPSLFNLGGNISEIEFVFNRVLNYKEVFLTELVANIKYFGISGEIIDELTTKYHTILKKWHNIKIKSIVNYNLNKRFDFSKQLAEVNGLELELREILGGVIKKLEVNKDVINQTTKFNKVVDITNLISKKNQSEQVIGPQKAEYESPRDEIEQKLASIWESLLKVKDVGINDNFFDWGGNSLTSVRLIAIAVKEFNVELPLELFFKLPTIKEFAQYIRNNPGSSLYSPIPLAPPMKYYPLSAAQKRLFVVDQFNKNRITYNVTLGMERENSFDRTKVQTALQELVRRHESLRTYFTVLDGVPVQCIVDDLKLNLEYAEVTENEVDKIIKDFVKPFDLLIAPLFRAILIKTPERSLLILDMPHIITDGVSVGILMNEFSAIYNNEINELLPLQIQYKDYALWQENALNNQEVKNQEAYCLSVLKEIFPSLTFR